MLLVPVQAFDAVQEVVLLELQVSVVEPLYGSVVVPAEKVSVGGIGVGVGVFVGVGVGTFVGAGVFGLDETSTSLGNQTAIS